MWWQFWPNGIQQHWSEQIMVSNEDLWQQGLDVRTVSGHCHVRHRSLCILVLMLCKGRTSPGHHCFPTTMPLASGELRRTRVSSKLMIKGSFPFSDALRHRKSRHCQKPCAWAHGVKSPGTLPRGNVSGKTVHFLENPWSPVSIVGPKLGPFLGPKFGTVFRSPIKICLIIQSSGSESGSGIRSCF